MNSYHLKTFLLEVFYNNLELDTQSIYRYILCRDLTISQ